MAVEGLLLVFQFIAGRPQGTGSTDRGYAAGSAPCTASRDSPGAGNAASLDAASGDMVKGLHRAALETETRPLPGPSSTTTH